MNNNLLVHVFIFLASAALIVPLASRFKLSSVLGYLIIGVLIGPYGFRLIGNANQIMHFAEFGIVMMLFVIGLELEPATLWRLRKAIVGLGSLQVIVTSLCLCLIGLLLGQPWHVSLVIGMALSLSSTALVLQVLKEKDLLRTAEGETSFAVLLFQDIAVIPILVIMPLLAVAGHAELVQPSRFMALFPTWMHPIIVAGVIGIMIATGHFLSHYLFSMIAKTNLREVFTATSLALIVGITLLMQAVGVSPALGAFVAGVVLANSDYKRTLEADIEPFKGLLLGLFFISVGMGINFNLLSEQPLQLFSMVALLIVVKAIILTILGRQFGLTKIQTLGFALALSQGGEFAFVLFQYAYNSKVINSETASFYTLVVTLSMAITPFLLLIYHRFIVPRYITKLPKQKFDKILPQHNHVILVGYGRVGQIIGRFLTGHRVKITILEKNPDQIDLLRKFGFKGYFGDATRLDLLKNAGADEAKFLIVAVGDPDDHLEIVKLAKQYFPHLKIYSRARNRSHAYELHKAGVDYFKRETFESALTMAQEIMVALGYNRDGLRRKANAFRQLDEASLQKSFEFFEKEAELISFSRQVSGELERILQDDLKESSLTSKS